jgi:1-acylglycerone phosphate reductase
MEVDLQEARQLFETNFFAVILMSQTFLPLLLKSKGTIVQIGSVSGVSTAGIQLYLRDHVDCSR